MNIRSNNKYGHDTKCRLAFCNYSCACYCSICRFIIQKRRVTKHCTMRLSHWSFIVTFVFFTVCGYLLIALNINRAILTRWTYVITCTNTKRNHKRKLYHTYIYRLHIGNEMGRMNIRHEYGHDKNDWLAFWKPLLCVKSVERRNIALCDYHTEVL